MDAGGHLVYCLREIFGEIESVTGYTARLSRPEMEVEDHAAATLRYRSGALAQLFVRARDVLESGDDTGTFLEDGRRQLFRMFAEVLSTCLPQYVFYRFGVLCDDS